MLLQSKTGKKARQKPQIVMQQREADCGAACFASVLKFYGVKKINLSAIHELLNTGRDGTNFEQLGDAFAKIGIVSKPVETNLTLLQTRFGDSPQNSDPIILHWKGNHFIVLYKFTKKGALIADPAIGIYTIPLEEFSEKWTNFALIITKTDEFKPEVHSFQSPNVWGKFFPIAWKKRRVFILVFVLAVLLQFLALVNPLAMKYLFDNLITASKSNFIDILFAGLLLVIVVDAIFQFIRSFVLAQAEQKLNLTMKAVFFEHLFTLPVSYFSRHRTGDLVTLNGDTGTIGQLIAGRTLVTALDLLTFVTYLAFLSYLQIKLVVLAVFLIPLYGAAVFVSARFLQKLYRLNFAKSAELSSYVFE
ncbi:MAG: cysteine peptidase family C39 domain-containing protein, partial [Pyrinomonadaceae bacterium]